MTPQEKAKELYDKMKGFRVKNTHRKKCALIAAKEVINQIHPDMAQYGFWEDVIEEISKK